MALALQKEVREEAEVEGAEGGEEATGKVES